LGTEKGIYNIPTKIYERIYASEDPSAQPGGHDTFHDPRDIGGAHPEAAGRHPEKGSLPDHRGKKHAPHGCSSFRGSRSLSWSSAFYTSPLPSFCPPSPYSWWEGSKHTAFYHLKKHDLEQLPENLPMEDDADAVVELALSVPGRGGRDHAGRNHDFHVIVKMKVRGKFLLQFLGVLPFSLPGP
jgi:iron(III) transport system permease protein